MVGNDFAPPPRRLRLLAVLLAFWAPVAVAQEAAEIQALRLEAAGRETYLHVAADGELTWTASGDDVRLVLRFPDCRPGAAVHDLEGKGLVTAVRVGLDPEARRPTTLVVVEAREPVSLQADRRQDGLLLRFRPVPGRRQAPPPTPRGTAANPAPVVSPIGVRDVLSIEVFGIDELNRDRIRVQGDGTISLPLLGEVEVAGLSVAQAEQKLARLLAERRLARDPRVSVFIEEHISDSVNVQGAVRTPGFYALEGRKSLFTVLVEAGGLSEQAGNTIVVLRHRTDGTEERFEVDAERLIEGGEVELDLPLVAGDVVTVPHRRTFRVYVNGAVQKPGPVEYSSSEGITVLQAITAAGGMTERAKSGKVHILRRHSDGTQERIPVPLKKIKNGKAPDVKLQKNDIVVVGEWFL